MKTQKRKEKTGQEQQKTKERRKNKQIKQNNTK